MTSATVADRRGRPGGTLRTVLVIVAMTLAGSVLLLAGLLLGRLSSPAASPPSTTSAEAGFARDMQTHHNQAVEMALVIHAKTDDDAISTLSYDIASSQAQQAGQMFAWLNTWGLSQAPSEPVMTWMARPALAGASHEHGDDMGHTPGGQMPGLATTEQIRELRAATGDDADRIFLELMIDHHLGGVEMAKAVLDRSDEKVVDDLASGIVTVQESEITYMEELLTELD